MSLLPLIQPGEGDEAQNAFLAKVPPLNLFKALAHAPQAAALTAEYGAMVLYRTALDPKLRELAILRAAHMAGSAYEVGHHERIGRDVGLTGAQLAAVRNDGDIHALSTPERIVVQWAEEVGLDGQASRRLVVEAVEAFGLARTVELSLAVGYYLMVASFLNTFRVPFEGPGFSDGVDINARPRGA
ncbi:carboxymuconolactone decarboxylase family protein [Phenylobacterium sp.]|uniref:carboxymuconolactone decarboxylase family protein n=1 Tax=Phenylobacterium sp. TaxID=1871053 RepID=UPI0035B442F3